MRTPLLFTAALLFTLSGCSRDKIEAVNRSLEGDKAKKGGNVDEAISKYEQGARLDPSNHRILWKLCYSFLSKENWEKTAEACKNAARASETEGSKKKAPSFANYYATWGNAVRMLSEKGQAQWADAKEPLETAAKIDPNIAGVYADLAEVSLHLDQEQEALRYYSKAIETRPTEFQSWGQLAQLYLDLGYYGEAEQVLKEGLSMVGTPKADDPKSVRAAFNLHTLMGSLREIKKDNQAALDEYKKAQDLCKACNERGYQIAFFNLGNALLQAGKKDEAVAQLKSFNKLICRGAGKKSYEPECEQTADLVRKAGGSL